MRDRRGRPVTDLTLEDFELLEDGVAQRVGAMSLIAPDTPPDAARRLFYTGLPASDAAAGERTASEGADAVPGQAVVAIVFERLAPQSRLSATKAALAYLETPQRPDDFVGVFFVDNRLETVQTFTNDRDALKAALESAAGRAAGFLSVGTVTAPPVSPVVDARGVGVSAGSGHEGSSASSLGFIAEFEDRLSAEFRQYERLFHGYASLNALRAVVSSLGMLPGRKTIVYFSGGLLLNTGSGSALGVGGDGLRAKFDALIQEANRFNVSVYPIDAEGLRTQSQDLARAGNLRSAINADLGADTAASLGGGGAAMRASIEATAGGTTSFVFGRLAQETGGFVIENTNDLAGGFRRVDADRRFHYLLTYTPRNSEFNGEYRRIEVKVKRSGVSVRARSGYVADNSLSVIPTLEYEAGALAALAASPPPAALALDARVLHLPSAAAPGQLAVVVRVPGSSVTHKPEAALGQYRTDFTVLARIRDTAGKVVRKGSQPYRLSGPLENLGAAQHGDVLFFRQPQLDPGRYTVDVAVHDALASRAAVRALPLEIGDVTDGGLFAGDLVVVQRAERVKPGEVDADNPLLVGGEVLLYPNVGEPLATGASQVLPLYMSLRPVPGRSGTTGQLSLVRDGKTVVVAPLQIGSPGADGFVRQIVRLPLDKVSAGEYVVRLDVTDGQDEVSRSAAVTLR